jgi:5-methylcytosine-specific restriction endonuclease McrBC regulatory subunit McrC
LKGKLRSVDQIRDPKGTAGPPGFHVDEPVFDLHTPWNRIAKSTLNALLSRGAELSPTMIQRLEATALPFSAIPDQPATDADFAATLAEPRAAGYGALLEVCKLILDAMNHTSAPGAGMGSFLIDLGRAFKRYLATGLERAFASRQGWSVITQLTFRIGPTELSPDVLIRKDDEPWAVLNAKWKTANPDADDLQQVLAYATLTGALRVAIVYPGKSDNQAHFATPERRVRVSLYRLRVIGTAAELNQGITRLALSV